MPIGHVNFISQCCRGIKDNFNKHFSHSIADKLRAIFNQSVELSLASKLTKQTVVKPNIALLCLEMEKRIRNNDIYCYEEAKTNRNINVIKLIGVKELQKLSKVSDARLYKQLIHHLNSNSSKEQFNEIYRYNGGEYNPINLNKYADKDDFIAIMNVLSLLYYFCDLREDKLVICKDMAYLFKKYYVNKSDIFIMIDDVLDKWLIISDILSNNEKSLDY